MLSGVADNPAVLASTVSGSGTLSLGSLFLTGYGILNMMAETRISSLAAIKITGPGNLLSVGGTFGNGTYTLVAGSSLFASDIALTGGAVGGSTLSLGSAGIVGRSTIIFTNSPAALQVIVVGAPWNIAFNGSSGSWNTSRSDAILTP